MKLSERYTVILLLSVMKGLFKGFRTQASDCFPSALEMNVHI